MSEEKKQLRNRIEFWLCLATTIGLFVGGFFVPPTGVIDGSLLSAAGILFGFATLAQVPVIIGSAKTAKITHGDTTIEVSRKQGQPQDEDK
jgi:hypothetical protein